MKSKVATYTGIPCAFWKRSGGNIEDRNKAIGTDLNSYEVNLEGIYTDVQINDLMEIDGKSYNVDTVILHHNRLGALDNLQVFISAMDNVN